MGLVADTIVSSPALQYRSWSQAIQLIVDYPLVVMCLAVGLKKVSITPQDITPFAIRHGTNSKTRRHENFK